MAEDIVTRLRNGFTTHEYPMLKDRCESCAIPKEWGGHHYNCLYDAAADEIQSLRAKLALTEDEMVRMARMMSEMTESYRQLREEYEKVRGDA